jgi:hypothetical protein
MMIDLIAFPFLSLVVFITAMRVMRSLREVRAARARQTALMVPDDFRKPSDDFHDQTWLPLCNKIANSAIAKLTRPLTCDERRIIWRTRAPLTLEVVWSEIESASTAEQIMELLYSLPPGMDRPDPTGWCQPGA